MELGMMQHLHVQRTRKSWLLTHVFDITLLHWSRRRCSLFYCDSQQFLAHYYIYLPDSGSKLVANAEVAPEDCGYTACRRGTE